MAGVQLIIGINIQMVVGLIIIQNIQCKEMIYLTVFNSIISIIVFIYICYNHFPLYLEVNKTCWCKKPYSITLWRVTSGNRRAGTYSGSGVFTIRFRNEDKLREWDSNMFRSGEYKKYS